MQVAVAGRWHPPYSWHRNTISDLGARGCALFGRRAVCSPWHGLLNASLVVLGATMAGGALLLHRRRRRGGAGFALMAAAGAGAALVGLFPEDVAAGPHVLGAGLSFLLGNVAMIVLGRRLHVPCWLRRYSAASGTIGLIGLCLFLSRHRLGLGLGGMERVVAYPQTLWLTVFGYYELRDRLHAAPT